MNGGCLHVLRTRKVVYPESMKNAKSLLAALLTTATAATAAPAPSQCKADEVTYFNCALRPANKLVSLCGKHNGAASYLQYRAGTPGAPPEVAYPATRGGAEMKEAFFFNDRQDSSRADTGVWFRRSNTYYELKYGRDIGNVGQISGARSEVLMWIGTPKGAPRPLVCRQANGGAQLSEAKAVIEALSPKGRRWQLSPLDVHYLPKQQQTLPAAPMADPRAAPASETVPHPADAEVEVKEESAQ